MALHLERSSKHVTWMRNVVEADETRTLWLNIIRSYFPLGTDWLVFPEGDHVNREMPAMLTLFSIDTKVPKGELPRKHGVVMVQHTELRAEPGQMPNEEYWESATSHLVHVFEMLPPRPPGAPAVGIVASGPYFIAIEQNPRGEHGDGFTLVPIETSSGAPCAHVVDDGELVAQLVKKIMKRFDATIGRVGR